MLASSFVACAPGGAQLCADWASAECSGEYPNLVTGLTEEECNENFDFSCRNQTCDAEYEALILCQTDYPTCCNGVGCDNTALTACASEDDAWTSCFRRVRDACR